MIRCANCAEVRAQVQEPIPWLPRGAGCSYGDAAILDEGRLLLLDGPQRSSTTVSNSDSIVVSSAETLRRLLSTLANEGLTLPVVPGVLDATVGGVLAADAHGKNHPVRGSLRDVTRSIRLVLPSGEEVECDRDRNQDLFEATIGGMGLTGMIVEAQLDVIAYGGPNASVEVLTTPDLESSLEQLRQLGQRQEHVAAWLDPTAPDDAFGRGIVVGGTANNHGGNENRSWNFSRALPFPPGLGGFLGPTTLRWHNNFRYRFAGRSDRVRSWKLEQLLFPLDRWSNWKRIYQPRGFHQHQSLIPHSCCQQAIKKLLKIACSGALEPTLVVLKCMRSGGGWLSFPEQGMTLTMDIRADEDSPEILRRLDQEVAEQGGRVYLAKDTTLTPELLARMYPDLPRFLELRQRIDPDRKIASDLSRRLDL
ncbi:MAG TPA: FAD-binding oxidoreductase [Planctomycetes bacterium]|nr:FAD-binding oxidoreductase [Planctomycetota bacterium]